MVYNPHTTEGYYVDERGGAYDIGGNGYYVVGVTSNGFGDYTLVDSCDLSVSSQEDIKRAIMAFGGVTAGISDNSNNYTWANDTYTMIAGPGDPFEHSVVLVGWDDSFPATAFSTTASTDGAWYVQNSYSRSWGDDGYYWSSSASGSISAAWSATREWALRSCATSAARTQRATDCCAPRLPP